jgi:hypothetical protein
MQAECVKGHKTRLRGGARLSSWVGQSASTAVQLLTELWGMPEARGWDEEVPNGVPHATEWIAAGFPTCVDGGSAPLGGEGPQQFILRHLGDNESRLSSPAWESRSYI